MIKQHYWQMIFSLISSIALQYTDNQKAVSSYRLEASSTSFRKKELTNENLLFDDWRAGPLSEHLLIERNALLFSWKIALHF